MGRFSPVESFPVKRRNSVWSFTPKLEKLQIKEKTIFIFALHQLSACNVVLGEIQFGECEDAQPLLNEVSNVWISNSEHFSNVQFWTNHTFKKWKSPKCIFTFVRLSFPLPSWDVQSCPIFRLLCYIYQRWPLFFSEQKFLSSRKTNF